MHPITLITGASSGLGFALTQELVNRGHTVLALARRLEPLAQLQQQFPEQLRLFAVDITSDTEVKQATAEIQRQFSHLDHLVLNAGTCEYVDVRHFDKSLFERVFSVNVLGQVRCIEAWLPLLRKSPQAQLTVVSSLAHLFPFTQNQAYGASKAALSYLADSLRLDLAEQGIGVTLIEPGFVETPLTAKNDFPMPFLLSAAAAARRMADAIERRQVRCRFPRRLAWTLGMLRWLPYSWRQSLAVQLK